MDFFIIGEIKSPSKKETLVFNVPLKNGNEVIVNILPNKKKAESLYTLQISKELFERINLNFFDDKILTREGKIKERIKKETKLITHEFCDDLLEIQSTIANSTRKVVNLLKYCLHIQEISPILTGDGTLYWSLDNSKWQKINLMHTAVAYPIIHFELNDATVQYIQEHINNDFEPFISLQYLHKAFEERVPSSMWIDATIAAELAIKEFLIRKEPLLEHLLLEIPSPPLYKLYGSILEQYAGEKSPKLSEIKKGVEIRNQLIHKPNSSSVNEDRARTYVYDIEAAIYHLLFLLYPDDGCIQSVIKRT
jgi:hypothetical protein